MDFKILVSVLPSVILLIAAVINSYKIIKQQVQPALSTWLIILAAALMSFVTYLSAEQNAFLSGLLNFGDVLSTALVSVVIIFFSQINIKLKSFEKYYLLGLILVAAFWFLTSDPFVSNLLIQLLLSIGYAPTIHHLIKSKRNTESFLVWGLILAASLISLYPAIIALTEHGIILSLIYSVRAIILLSITIILMKYYSYFDNKPVTNF